MTESPLGLIEQHGLALVLLNVFLERMGLPVPAAPALIVAGALAATGRMDAAGLFVGALVACMVADGLWFAAGRRFGARILKSLCRISLSQDSCVNQSTLQFERFGAGALVFSKFLPGVSGLIQPLAGSMQFAWRPFLVLNALGSILWIGACLVLGWLFRAEIDPLLARLTYFAGIALCAVVALFIVYLGYRWLRRLAFRRGLRMARISAEELKALIDSGQAPVIVDLRGAGVRAADTRVIPGARALAGEALEASLKELPLSARIVLYCGCPEEASAALAARRLHERGFEQARPLRDGLDGWESAGFPFAAAASEALAS